MMQIIYSPSMGLEMVSTSCSWRVSRSNLETRKLRETLQQTKAVMIKVRESAPIRFLLLEKFVKGSTVQRHLSRYNLQCSGALFQRGIAGAVGAGGATSLALATIVLLDELPSIPCTCSIVLSSTFKTLLKPLKVLPSPNFE